MTLPTFDVHEIPFSRRGSWLNLSPVIALHTFADVIHLVSHQTGMHGVLSLAPLHNDETIATTISSTPAELVWASENGRVSAIFEALDTLRLQGSRLDMRIADATAVLTPFTGTFFFEDPIDGSAIFTSYETGRRYRVTCIRGSMRFEGAEALGASQRAVVLSGSDGWEAIVEEFETSRPAYAQSASFDDARAAIEREFNDYLEMVAGWRTDATPGAALAAYVMWSATVSPRGFLRRESMLMSKHWMDKVWSWDHCFNAMALAPGDLALALDQFFTPFDHQESSGALPDSVTHSEILYNFVKPPIHGWAFAKLRARATVPVSDETLRAVYSHLSAWSRFWLDARRVAGHALPHYQHGNDSGWDNSTTFDYDRLIESPDLAAFLITQLDQVASLADELATGEGDQWRTERDALRDALVAELWDDGKFIGLGVLNRRRSKTTSLLNLLPIVATDQLDDEITSALANDIAAHVTEWGPATQLLDTDEYEDDGYWRGPIWAPSTVIIEDGVRRAGHDELANTISERFRRLCEKSGFAENFDAVSGEGLRDRAYTWTASAYLLLAHEAVIAGRP
jgi:glycogen debranching enzyme